MGKKRIASSQSKIKKYEDKLKQAEDKTAFRICNYDVKRRHVFSFATLMFIFALSLRTFNKYVEQGKEPSCSAVAIMFIVSLVIIFLLVIRKHKQWQVEHNVKNIFRRTATLYFSTCIVILIFSLIHWAIQGYFFPLKEFMFILSISIVFSTITLDTL